MPAPLRVQALQRATSNARFQGSKRRDSSFEDCPNLKLKRAFVQSSAKTATPASKSFSAAPASLLGGLKKPCALLESDLNVQASSTQPQTAWEHDLEAKREALAQLDNMHALWLYLELHSTLFDFMHRQMHCPYDTGLILGPKAEQHHLDEHRQDLKAQYEDLKAQIVKEFSMEIGPLAKQVSSFRR